MADYSTLLQDIQDWCEDDDTEFVAEIPHIIARAEQYLFSKLPQRLDYNLSSTGTLTLGTREFTHGVVGLRQIREFMITTAGGDTDHLDRRTESFIDLFTPDSTTTGTPKFYAQTDSDTIVLAPTPDAAYAFTLRYRGLPTGLSASNTTSWLTVDHYDILLDACIVESMRFKEDDEGLVRWTKALNEKLAALASETLGTYQNDDTTGV